MTDTTLPRTFGEEISLQTDDERRVYELHEGFVAGNRVGDHTFLEAHMAPGPDHLTWFNLNESNYVGVDHIVELWKFLVMVSGGKEAKADVVEERMEVTDEMAYVAYRLDFAADFGNLGTYEQVARATEIWRKLDGDWKMVHFHCSNHTPDVMGGV